MADPFDLMAYNLTQELEALHRDMIAAARQKIVKGELKEGEDAILEGKVTVDLNAILRSSTSSRSVLEVQQAEGEEDNPPVENARNQKEG